MKVNGTKFHPCYLQIPNYSSSKFAEVITSGIPTTMQNFIQIEFCFHACTTLHSHLFAPPFFVFVFLGGIGLLQIIHTTKDSCTNFNEKCVKKMLFHVRMCLFGVTKIFTLRPSFPKNSILRLNFNGFNYSTVNNP